MCKQIHLHKTLPITTTRPKPLLPNMKLIVKGEKLNLKSRRPKLDFKLPF